MRVEYLTGETHAREEGVVFVKDVCQGFPVSLDIYPRVSTSYAVNKRKRNIRNGSKNPKLPIEKLTTGGTSPALEYKLET